MSLPTPPCLSTALLGEWKILLGAPSTSISPVVPTCEFVTPPTKPFLVRLETPDRAAAWVPSSLGGFAQSMEIGGYTTLGSTDGVEISVNGTTFTSLFSNENCKTAANLTGVYHDASAEAWGCFVATRNDEECGEECHGAAATTKADAAGGTFTRKLRVGTRTKPTKALVPPPAHLIEPTTPPLAAEEDAALAATVINASKGLLWRSASNAVEAYARLHPRLAPTALPKAAIATRRNSSSFTVPAGLPSSLDWRSHNGGGWLSPLSTEEAYVNDVPTLCKSSYQIGHAITAVQSFEARIKIASMRKQSESLSPIDGLAGAARRLSPSAPACGRPLSAYLVGQYAREFGLARASCLAITNSSVPPPVSGDAWSAALPACSPRRLARSVRYVGGYYGGANEVNLIRELQLGPIAVSLYADTDLALYGSGIYHPTGADYWTRLLGRTRPAFDLSKCLSHCEPPKTLEWQEVNLAAELVGYGSEAGAGYWILRVPWGVGWGEGGYMRVLRSEAAIFDAVAIDPMV